MAERAHYILADFFLMDLADMPRYRYQPTTWRNPAIYTFGEDGYYAVPPAGKPMPPNYAGLKWTPHAEHRGRIIYIASGDLE